ncbi:MAG: hypothetical protein A2V70_03155 [Planctomycetes bacterium RBG_13_63_9]|nr:MAG: hypothetical protein A2V70_03155 [Planctomycetes bacterium RBG_13_63_9]
MSDRPNSPTSAEPEPAHSLPKEPDNTVAPPTRPPAATAGSGRVIAIDALRGFDMFWIIGGMSVVLAIPVLLGVDVPDWVEEQRHHAAWIGFTAEDLIMPLFLFIVGVAMPFSFAKRLAQRQSKARLHVKIVWRTIILFVLGMVAQGHLLDFNLETLRIYCNTLQAIACGYFFSALLILHLSLLWQIVTTALCLVTFWALMTFVPFASQPAGTLEPNLNLAMHVETWVFGRFTGGHDYTWILSGLGFIGSVMLGTFAGQLLCSAQHRFLKFLWLVLLGAACLGAGWLWSYHFPIIKHLWTSSMVLWASGWCFLLLALFYLVIDVIGFRCWAFPFVVIGANAIAVYMANSLISFHGLSDPLVGGLASHLGKYGDPVRTIAAFTVVWLILLHMYRKKTFIRI